jgi:lipopolysaccharide export system permease protein
VKIIDRYILKSYLTRLVSVFTICMFIFILQTFWLYIDDLAGKGLDILIIGKFLLYFSPKLIPLVLPLSVLLASLMTFGSLSENYEFAAMKSTGISLQRALLGLVIFHIALGIGTFYFSNHVIPYGELKSYNLRRNLTKLEPTLAIREGIFNEIGQYNIKVKNKYGDNDRFLEDVIIHEYTPNKQNNIVIKAERGEMKNDPTDPNLKLVLYNGNRYEEVIPKKVKNREREPHAKVSFEEYEMNIDLSQFNNVDLEEEKITTGYSMKKIDQLRISIDTLQN